MKIERLNAGRKYEYNVRSDDGTLLGSVCRTRVRRWHYRTPMYLAWQWSGRYKTRRGAVCALVEDMLQFSRTMIAESKKARNF